MYEIINNSLNILNKYSININNNNINKLKLLDNYTENEKGYYLSGLFEGDGNIYTRRFMIIFCLEDISLAHYLCEYFKIGYVEGKYNSNKELTAVVWYMINQRDQKVFINYINPAGPSQRAGAGGEW